MSLPPRTVTTARWSSRSISCLRRERGPVGLGLVAGAAGDHERPHPAALGDDVVGGEGLRQVEALVDLVEEELAVLVGDLGVRGVDARVGGADDRATAHRDDVEEALGVVEEGEHAVVAGRREARDDEVDALGVDDAVLGAQVPGLVEVVDERAGRVDDDPCRRGDLLARCRCRAGGRPSGRRCARRRRARRSWRPRRRPRAPSGRRRRRTGCRCRRGRRRGTRWRRGRRWCR